MQPGTAYLLAVQDRPIHTILCILSISGTGEFNKAKTSSFPSVKIQYQLAVAKQQNTASNQWQNRKTQYQMQQQEAAYPV